MAKAMVAVQWADKTRAPASLFAGIPVVGVDGEEQSQLVVVQLAPYAAVLQAATGHVWMALKQVDPKGVAKTRRDLDAFGKRATNYALRTHGTTRERFDALRAWFAECEKAGLGLEVKQV